MSDLVATPNGIFVTKEVAEAYGLEASKAKRKTTTRKPAARKTAGTRRKGK